MLRCLNGARQMRRAPRVATQFDGAVNESGATIVDLTAVCVGMTESHGWWRLPLLGHHILVAGATGAGKGSVLWSLVTGIAPSVKTGHVRLCVIDPKGGMELGAGAPLFTVFTHDATDTKIGRAHV